MFCSGLITDFSFCMDGEKASIDAIFGEIDNDSITSLVGVPKIIFCDYKHVTCLKQFVWRHVSVNTNKT